MDTMLGSTVSAAVQGIPGLHAVTDDLAAAMRAGRRQRVDGALEAVEYMGLTTHLDLKTFVVGVSADLTGRGLCTEHIFTFIHRNLFSEHG
jgi:hypothetical protein